MLNGFSVSRREQRAGTRLATCCLSVRRYMFTSLWASCALLVFIALLPGAISWSSGRRLARLADDPTLPELLAAHGRRNGVLLLIAMAGVGWVGSSTFSAFAIPIAFGGLIAFAGLIAAAYPLRRVLYRETWSFRSYLSFYPRVMAGFFAFWIVLGTMPSLVSLAGNWDWLAGAALAGVLVLWHNRYGDVVRSCLRTRPIPEGEFLSRCRALADACGVPQPRFERIDLEGGVVANAMALPSLGTSSVLFTDTVLDRFDREELLAICAHELAHFEHYNPARLRRWNLVTYSLIALGAACTPVARITGLDAGLLPHVLWLTAIVGTTALRARGKQRQETTCDLRAVELTGDADALVRGLTKLYTVARVPRRTEQQAERSATHPSLARRIRDIRKAAGVAPAALDAGHTFTSADGRSVVTFDDAELRWAVGDAETHCINYAHLTELRVDAKARRGSRLVALGPQAKRWEMKLADGDVARMQAVLDVVDGRIADPPRPSLIHPGIQRMVVLTAAALLLTLSHVAVAFVGLLALLKPSLPLLVGAALAAFTASALTFRDYADTAYVTMMSLPLAVTGLVLLGFAWGHRQDPRHGTRPFIAALALVAAVGVAAVTMNGVDVVRLHQNTRSMPSAIVLSVALAGALACSEVRRVRLAAVAVGLAALAMTVAASTAFLDRFATDPFLAHAPALDWVSVSPDAVREFAVPSGTQRIVLSPDGKHVATHQQSDEDDDHSSTFQIGRVGQALVSIAADDVDFVNDDQLLTVESDARGTTVKAVRLDASREVVWQHFVEGLFEPSLSFDRTSGRWRVMGWGGDDSIVRVTGTIGTSDVQKKQWPVPSSAGSYIDAMSGDGSEVLVVEKQYDRGLLARLMPRGWTWVYLLQPYNEISRYATIGDRGRRILGESNLGVDCLAEVLDDGLVCTVYDGSRTHIVKVNGTGPVEGIGFLAERFVSDQNVVRGWLTGWAGAGPIAIRLATGEALQLSGPPGAISLVSVASDRLAALRYGGAEVTVRVYALPPETRTAEAVRAERSAPVRDR
jgi:Zn-dependent protease with chaperone function